MKKNKKNKATFDVVNTHYIETKQMDLLVSQYDLLGHNDRTCVLISKACRKVINICIDYNLGVWYFTDRSSTERASSLGEIDLRKYNSDCDKINQPNGKSFVSVLLLGDRQYFIDHDEVIDQDDANRIKRAGQRSGYKDYIGCEHLE